MTHMDVPPLKPLFIILENGYEVTAYKAFCCSGCCLIIKGKVKGLSICHIEIVLRE